MGMRMVELLLETDGNLGDVAVVKVPRDIFTKVEPFLARKGIVVLPSFGRRYEVRAGNVRRLREAAGALHKALGQIFLN